MIFSNSGFSLKANKLLPSEETVISSKRGIAPINGTSNFLDKSFPPSYPKAYILFPFASMYDMFSITPIMLAFTFFDIIPERSATIVAFV